MSVPDDAHTCPPRADIPCPECGPSSARRSAIERIGDIVSTTLIVYAVVFAPAILVAPLVVAALLIAWMVQR